MDMWATGCVMYELITFAPLFPGKNEADQVQKIYSILGTPEKYVLDRYKTFSSSYESFAKLSPSGVPFSKLQTKRTISLLKGFLKYDTNKRFTAAQALRHSFFTYGSTRKVNSLTTKKEISGASKQKIRKIKSIYGNKKPIVSIRHKRIILPQIS